MDERKGRTLEQAQIKELSATTEHLRADVIRGQDQLVDAEQTERALSQLQAEAKELRKQAAEANMWKARTAALEAKDKALPRLPLRSADACNASHACDEASSPKGTSIGKPARN